MKNYQISLSRKGKAICPQCHRKSFVLYVDNRTGEPINPNVGKSDKANKCNFHYSPKQFFSDNPTLSQSVPFVPAVSMWDNGTPKISFVENSIVQKTLTCYGINNFVQFLIGRFGLEKTNDVVSRYSVGTTKSGGTIFWQIDHAGIVRGGKIMMYNPQTGKRVKGSKHPITWVHHVSEELKKLENYKLKQCLFGEHLLKDNAKSVAIVESEKSALIASLYLPKFIWLAVGGSEGLNIEKLSVLRGRSVVLYPDVGMFEKWKSKADEMKMFCKVSVSDLLERNATDDERHEGLDIADYLLRFDVPKIQIIKPQPLPKFDPSTGWYSYNDIYGIKK
jgi:hypothetical protein